MTASAPPVHVVVTRHGASLPQLEQLLGAGDRARLASEPEAARVRFLSGRTALVTAAARLTGSEPRSLVIDATCPDCGRSHGRPRILGPSSAVHVSLTHAEGRAIAVASATPVGVDAETREALRAQRATVGLIAPASRAVGVRHWTRIEAIVKADGRGLRIDPRNVTIVGRRGTVDGSVARYLLTAVHPVRGLVVSIAQEILVSGKAGRAA